MNHDEKQRGSPEAAFADWMKSMTDFWVSTAKTWSDGATPGGFGSPLTSESSTGRMQEGWQALLKTWQTSFSALSSPQTLEAILKGANAFPEAAMRIVRTTWDGYFQLHQMWVKHVGKLGEASKAYSFEGLEADVFKEWTAFYEKEIQPVLKIPQVGLTRIYQERLNDAMDKFSGFEVAIAEFLHLLSLPVERSMRVMQEKIEEEAKAGEVSENFKDYYNIWIRILEGHYMTLMKSPEYARSLSRTVTAVEEFKAARDGVFMDILQFVPVPTNRDMDALYKELYLLKKTVKELAKKVKRLESKT